MEFLDYTQLSKIINIAIATSKIEKLIIPHTVIRPFMHILLYGRVGSGKSTILRDVLKKVGQMPVTNLTKATLYGAVDKTSGSFIPPVTWDSKNSVLGLDEFYIPKEGTARYIAHELISLMENPFYTKKIGYRCNEFNDKTKDGLFCRVKKNRIEVKTRFVLFANTMMNLNLNKKMENYDVVAFASRCLVIPYYPSLDDLKRKARGEPYYIYKELTPKKSIVKISKQQYNKILSFAEDYNINETNYLRTIGDLCRTFAVVGFKEEIFKMIMKIKEFRTNKSNKGRIFEEV